MGYFPNGCSAMDYEARFCDHCVHQKPHDGGCSVWYAHLLFNYDEVNREAKVLNLLIPKAPDGLSNLECTMFHPQDAGRCMDTPDMFGGTDKE